MIELQPHAEGVLLPVRAQPGASKAGIRGQHGGMLKVAVTQIAEKGKANKALIDVLSRELDLRKSQIELVSGETAAQKNFLIRDVETAELQQRIQAALDQL
jgi:uncharacterized protein (TIGR00251 family)